MFRGMELNFEQESWNSIVARKNLPTKVSRKKIPGEAARRMSWFRWKTRSVSFVGGQTVPTGVLGANWSWFRLTKNHGAVCVFTVTAGAGAENWERPPWKPRTQQIAIVLMRLMPVVGYCYSFPVLKYTVSSFR
jgi:hypothetical protein